MNTETLVDLLQAGDIKALARAISLVENAASGAQPLLQRLSITETKVTGITGPPGAGKSTLVDAYVEELLKQGKRAGVLCVDPSSPFHAGALLGDRIRMTRWHNNEAVYIRSLASRGNLGGISVRMMEITDVMKAAGFDEIIIETVGVGQSEVEIASLADLTVVVLVPEAGDEIQSMKSGLMEIADLFVVNKADRPGADAFALQLAAMLPFNGQAGKIPIVKTIASSAAGIPELVTTLTGLKSRYPREKKLQLLTEKAYRLIQQKKMRGIDRQSLRGQIESATLKDTFNVYAFVNDLF